MMHAGSERKLPYVTAPSHIEFESVCPCGSPRPGAAAGPGECVSER